MKPEHLTTAAKYFGIVCAVLALGAIAYLLATGDWQSIRSNFGVLPFILAVSSYLSGLVILAVSWSLAVSGPLLLIMAIYGRTSLGKYLPGNVGHFVLRQTELGRLGMRQWKIAAASFEEITTQISAALLLAGLAVFWTGPEGLIGVGAAQIEFQNWLNILAGLAVVASFLLNAALAWRRLFNIKRFAARLFWAASFEAAGFVLLTQLVSLESAASAIGLFSLAWLGGFVAFGAPGGIGVREAIIAALLSPLIGAPTAAALAVVLRLACVAGDTVFAGITHLAAARYSTHAAGSLPGSPTVSKNHGPVAQQDRATDS